MKWMGILVILNKKHPCDVPCEDGNYHDLKFFLKNGGPYCKGYEPLTLYIVQLLFSKRVHCGHG